MRYLLFTLLFLLSFSNLAYSGDTLKVAYTAAPPFIHAEDNRLDGVSVWLWQKCAEELQLNYQLIPMGFSEMLDSLETDGIDISINPLTITADRMDNMQFTMPFYASHSIVVKGHYSTIEWLFNMLVSVFSLSFLSGFMVLFLLIALFGFLIWIFERRSNHLHFREGYKGVWDGLWWSVVTLTTVGYGDKSPKTRGGKIVALVWMFSGLLFISGMTASVASSLTINRLSSETSDLEHFKDRAIGTIKYSSSDNYLKDHFFKNVQLYSSVPEGLDALLKHEIEGFFYDEPIIYHRLKNEEKYSKLVLLPQQYGVQFYAFALSNKHQDLKAQLSAKMIDISEKIEWQRVLLEYGCGTY